MNNLFKLIYDAQETYKTGLVDKTDTLAFIADAVGKEVLSNAADNRTKANDIDFASRNLEKIRHIVAL